MFLVISVLIFSSCEVKDIEIVRVADVKIEQVKKGKIDGLITIVLNNPNRFAVKVKSADLGIWANNTEMGKAKLKESFKISANDSKAYPIKMNGDMTGAITGGISSILGLLSGNDPKITLKGEIVVSSFLVTRTIPIEKETDISLSTLMR
ncbi:MAG: hypothetical protein Salg2KO_09800 [Salibacteraceae bacterium]